MTVEEIKENSKIVYNIMQGRPSIKIRLNDLETDCLLDNGAHVNAIDSKIIEQMPGVILEGTEERLRADNESVIKTLEKVKLKTEINSDVRWIEFIVVEKLSPYVNLQKQFGINLTKEISNDDTTDNYLCQIIANFGKTVTDEQRFEKAISTFKIDKSSKIYNLVNLTNLNKKNMF